MSKQLSVIIPFCQEFPMSVFTAQNIVENINDKIDCEIILIDNKSLRVKPDKENVRAKIDLIEKESKTREDFINKLECYMTGARAGVDLTGEFFNKTDDHYKYIIYDEAQSHWQSKNLAISLAQSDVLMFCDAHHIFSDGAIPEMYQYYIDHYDEINGTLHLPTIGFMQSKGKALIYGIKYNKPKGVLHYSYQTMGQRDGVFKVPAMITHGMMVSKKILEDMAMFPKTLGIWGGGEGSLHYVMAIMGYHLNIFPHHRIRHWAGGAVQRGYTFNHWDLYRNRCIAVYLAGGDEWLWNYAKGESGPEEQRFPIAQSVLNEYKWHRDMIVSKQKCTIEEWIHTVPKEYIKELEL